MKRFSKLFLMLLCAMALSHVSVTAQNNGWPSKYGGVMLQGFYWDSYDASSWKNLESKASDLKGYIDLVWIPQSAYAGGTSMGYDDLYWFENYNSSFGTEAQLRSLISTYKANGIGTIADVVINHRKTPNDWFTFPTETYNGVTYHLLPSDIVADDDGGKAATQAAAQGVSLSTYNDSGEGWDGMRDLDHNSANVQANVKAYLKMLLGDFGYAGFRYDMVKGYSGTFTGLYNSDSNPTYSVGEYWDGNVTNVTNWINATKVSGNIQSAAFDFPFRYTVRDAINNSDWTKLANSSVMSDANYRRYAVTFVENHDTEYRSATASQDPIRKDTLAANAFMLAMPGTPCIFYKHWLSYENELKQMIEVRKLVGINNESTYSSYSKSTAAFANTVTGTNGRLLVVVGNTANINPSTTLWQKVASGYHYAYYIDKTQTQAAWTSVPSGEYTAASLDVTLTAVTSASGAQLVYTTDGTTPTATSTKVASGATVTIPEGTTTLKVGLLIGGTVSGVITRTYTVTAPQPFEPYTINVYVNTDQVGWNTYVNFHTWGSYRTGTTWPGDKVTTTATVNGKTWFTKSYNITTADDYVNFVFSIGTSSNASSNQSVDVTGVTQNAYFEISSTKLNGKYTVNDVTSDITTGIDAVVAAPSTTADDAWYTLSGVRISKPTTKGIYIHQGKKYVVR
jgi:alpha-amylase